MQKEKVYYKKDFKTKNQKKKFLTKYFMRVTLEECVFPEIIENGDMPANHGGFFATLNKYLDDIWDYTWELCTEA